MRQHTCRGPNKNKKWISDKSRGHNEIRKNNVLVNILYIPVHRQPYYENLGFKKNDFPVAEKFYQEVICIPMYPALQDKHQEYVIETIRKVMI